MPNRTLGDFLDYCVSMTGADSEAVAYLNALIEQQGSAAEVADETAMAAILAPMLPRTKQPEL